MTTGGNWEIEDASLYNGVWLYALMGYADTRDEFSELFRTPEIYYYYAQYFLNLMAPKGMVADFGDANWNSNWRHFLVFFEAAARQYGDPQLKWAASVVACTAPGFLDSGLTVFAAPGRGFDSRISPASTVRCMSA